MLPYSESGRGVKVGGMLVEVEDGMANVEIQGLETISEKATEMNKQAKEHKGGCSSRTSTSHRLRKWCLWIAVLERILKIMKMDTILKC